MGKRNFGAIKCLLHFDYPYFNEPNDGLDDEVGLETWSKGSTNTALFGSAIPNAGTRAPKFGYRCLRPYTGGIVGTNNTGIWNLNSSNDCEIECFLFGTSSGTRHLLRLCNSSGSEVFTVSITTARTISVLCPDWGITSAVTTESAFTASSWQHILLRISNNTLKVFIQGSEALSQELTPDVTLSVDTVHLGYSSTAAALYLDEFVFRHAAGSSAPAVPTESYSGVLDISKVGGFGTGSDGDLTISANRTGLGRSGVITNNDYWVSDNSSYRPLQNGQYLTVKSWSSGSYSATVGGELMIHVTAPKSTNLAEYPLAGLYAFGRIKQINTTTNGTSIELEEAINTENGYDFTLNGELLSTYYVQAIVVPNFKDLTVNSGITVTANSWSTSTGGGIIVFRCTGDCSINGSIITHEFSNHSIGYGANRNDYQQMTHSKLIDRFLCSRGGGIFIACGGTFSAPSTARLGGSWSGNGENGNGAAGYGGNGGTVRSGYGSGGAGGVGGGGGGSAFYSTSQYADGGKAGSNGSSVTYAGGGGGGCGGKGGEASNTSYGVGGSGGGGQGNSGGSGGTGKKVNGNTSNSVNGANSAHFDGRSISGAGGGAAGGHGGYGYYATSTTAVDGIYGGMPGASIILICNKLNADTAALSTGGACGMQDYPGDSTKAGGGGGGGTGFCYIACRERMSA